ncbi:MAG: DegT/DnrJ/EryC1/StrS family aminotransferase [Burkholderiaceae bacterium]|jgi:dTDP-4-amino-4,6-dideoxygalactose transaminase|nr:DegT/DnrJ/EryC1/StrS family aminotransferase [Burkholderiaceae bacterium]
MSQPEVPFFSATGAAFGVDLLACMATVVQQGRYVLGPRVQAFELAFASYLGVAHAVGVANGTDALTLSLRALGIGPGERVLTAANAGCYASTAIAQAGAEPLYVEIDPQDMNLAPAAVEQALKAGPVAAVILTHLYGQMAPVERIAAACRAACVPLIEDCAQAHGAARNGRKAGAWGALACFSFYPTKNLGALGDGGLVATADAALAERVRALRQYGWSGKYQVTLPGGINSRLDELQAALLLAKLPHLDRANAERRAIAARYQAAFADLPLRLPPSMGSDYVAHLYVVRTPRRAELQAHLARHGIASEVHYPLPEHRQPVRSERAYDLGASGQVAKTCLIEGERRGSKGDGGLSLPVTEAACAEVLSLPCCLGLTSTQTARVIDGVRAFFNRESAC